MYQLLFPVAAILMTTASIAAAHRLSTQASQVKTKARKESNTAIPLRKL